MGQEIIAELAAATLANLYCPEANLGFSYEYVEAYAKKSKKTIELLLPFQPIPRYHSKIK